MNHWLVFDTETTGLLKPAPVPLKDQPQIVELALVVISYNAGESLITGEKSWLINPGVSLSAEIIRITGLKDEDLKDKPRFGEVLPEIVDWFLGARGVIAHNLPFDWGMLTNELKRLDKECAFPYPPEQICTVQAFLHLKGRRMKMTELYEYAMKKPLEQTHRALDDARALAEIVLAQKVIPT